MSYQPNIWHMANQGNISRSDFLLPNDAAHFHGPIKTAVREPRVDIQSSSGPRKYGGPRVRDTPTNQSTIFTARDYNRYDVRDQHYHHDAHTDYSQRSSRTQTADGARPERTAKKMNCWTYPPVAPADTNKPKTRFEGQSHNAETYQKKGCATFVPRRPDETGDLKIGAPGGYLGPTPRFLPNPNKYETPGDFTVTLEVNNVGKKVEEDVLRRELASNGLNWMESQFYHNPVTNQRNGKGVVHVRVKNDAELAGVNKAINDSGMDVRVKGDYKPVWRKY
jgi:hypothetical protein